MNAHHHCQVRSIGCSCLQHGCQLHHHAADSVLTSGCSFISQQIWNTIFIVLAILGICIKNEKMSIGKRSMYIHISRWHTFDLGTLSCIIVTGRHRWRSGQMWRRVWRRCNCFSMPPLCLRIVCCAILAQKAAVSLIFANHCQVSFHCSLTFRCLGNSTLGFFSARTSVQRVLIMSCVFFIAAREDPCFAISAIFKARLMSDCSSCTWPPCLAILADMLKTYKKLAAASDVRFSYYLNHIRLRSLI